MITVFVLAFYLQDSAPEPVEEEEIVVTPQRRKSDVQDVPSAVTVVTAKQIEESRATNIVEILQSQPGFFSQGPNKGAYDQIMDLRGYGNGAGNGQRMIVLVDGRKTNDVSGSFTRWATIPVANIERIEIVRGPAAAIYGEGALAGVVNIITKKGGPSKSGRVTSSAGNMGTRSAMGSFTASEDGKIFDVSVGVESTQRWRSDLRYRRKRVMRDATSSGGRLQLSDEKA